MTDQVILSGEQIGYQPAIVNGETIKIDKLTRLFDEDEPSWLIVTNTAETYYLRGGGWVKRADGVIVYHGTSETPAPPYELF